MTTGEPRRGPDVSVVIPTHNRAALLAKVLDALRRQTYPLEAMEIVVVADGCHDGTLTMLEAADDLPLTVVQLAGVGPAAGRNAGAGVARAPLLVFLDDDVEPTPGLVEAHVGAHRDRPECVALGPYPPLPVPSRSLFRLSLRHWWTGHFAALAEPGHRMRHTDVLTGNLSMARETWAAVGGLDERLGAHEDYELGIRLFAAGVPVVFVPEALAHHHEHETAQLASGLRRSRDEGRADALIGEKHPHVRDGLRFVEWHRRGSRRTGLFLRLVHHGGRHLDGTAVLAQRLLAVLDRQGLRRPYSSLYRRLLIYWYLRGVSDSIPSFTARGDLARRPPAAGRAPALDLDLADGLPAAEAELDAARPQHVLLWFGAHRVGELPFAAAAEPWAGRHLRGHLVRYAAPAYLRALVDEGLVGGPDARDGLRKSIDRSGRFFTASRPPLTIWEQQEQWQVALRERSPDA